MFERDAATRHVLMVSKPPSPVVAELVVDALILTAVVKEAPDTSVINRDDITAMLQLESDKQMLGCTDDMSCLSEIGGALGVDKIIVGQVGRVEREYVVSLRLIEPSTAKVENRVLETFKGEETSLLHAMKQAGRRLMGLDAAQPGI